LLRKERNDNDKPTIVSGFHS